MARGKRSSVRSVLHCSIARPVEAVGSSTTFHRPSPPRPVRAKVKPAGGDPGIIRSMAIMGAPVSADADDPTHARQQAARAAFRTVFMLRKIPGPLLFTHNPPTRRVVRRAWTEAV